MTRRTIHRLDSFAASLHTVSRPNGDRSCLSDDELLRASMFHDPRDADRFIGRRSELRRVLGDVLDADAADLRFTYSDHSKPFIVGSDISFSSSSAGDDVAIVVSWSPSIGVDLVRHHQGAFDVSTARIVMHPNEIAAIEDSTDPDRVFADLWARKEAFAKADGRGLGDYVRRIDLSGAGSVSHRAFAVVDVGFWQGRSIAVASRTVDA